MLREEKKPVREHIVYDASYAKFPLAVNPGAENRSVIARGSGRGTGSMLNGFLSLFKLL